MSLTGGKAPNQTNRIEISPSLSKHDLEKLS